MQHGQLSDMQLKEALNEEATKQNFRQDIRKKVSKQQRQSKFKPALTFT
jgi:hypothetical protein